MQISKNRVQLILAAVLALAGIFAVTRMVLTTRSASEHRPSMRSDVTPAAEAIAQGDLDEAPTADSIDAYLASVADRAERVVRTDTPATFPAMRRTDLAAAFQERIEALIAPDPEKDRAARVARGQEPDPEADAALDSIRDRYALTPLHTQSIEFREVYRNGQRVMASKDEMLDSGISIGTTKLSKSRAFPMADLDPVKDQLDIVEMRVPMLAPTTIDGRPSYRRRVIGFQFVWSERRDMWIPWQNVSYNGDEGSSVIIPF